jgi:hypothetical protein
VALLASWAKPELSVRSSQRVEVETVPVSRLGMQLIEEAGAGGEGVGAGVLEARAGC